jgi:hypothetical protein
VYEEVELHASLPPTTHHPAPPRIAAQASWCVDRTSPGNRFRSGPRAADGKESHTRSRVSGATNCRQLLTFHLLISTINNVTDGIVLLNDSFACLLTVKRQEWLFVRDELGSRNPDRRRSRCSASNGPRVGIDRKQLQGQEGHPEQGGRDVQRQMDLGLASIASGYRVRKVIRSKEVEMSSVKWT